MGHRKTLQRFQELATLPNVIQKPANIAGYWQTYFTQPQPLVLELGCGYGEYTITLAQRRTQFNYIGMDIQGERLWRGAKASLTHGLKNVFWLRGQIDHLQQYFSPKEIHTIWLTFPDPFPKKHDENKRLTSPRFLEQYRRVLQPGGKIHLKTDARALIDYTETTLLTAKAIIDQPPLVVSTTETRFDLDITTRFEQKHRSLGEPIYYLAWHWSPTN